jgi:cysteinyl-tRNA synthetase
VLIDKGAAYERNGNVLFSVRKFRGYGKLSKRNLDDMRAGARVEIDEEKNDPLDFALWKKSKPSEPPEVCFDSPWGKGRPGWHIECSVMSTEALGSTLDIHGGGQDLIFPHHENEIAQSEAATGKPFANYWVHNGFVTVNKEKMSKSLGNFFTLSDILAKFPPRVVRYYLLGQHYRSPLDFSDDKLQAAASSLAGIDNAAMRLSVVPAPASGNRTLENLESAVLEPVLEKFREAMDDDFSTEKAIAVLHELKNDILNRATLEPEWSERAFNTIKLFMEDYLGIAMIKDETIPREVEALALQRAEARTAKDWKKSDDMRAAITAAGYKIEDLPGNKYRLLKI